MLAGAGGTIRTAATSIGKPCKRSSGRAATQWFVSSGQVPLAQILTVECKRIANKNVKITPTVILENVDCVDDRVD